MSARKTLLVIGENGYGKRVRTTEFETKKHRGGQGVRAAVGPLAAALLVRDSDELVVATRQGQMIRLAAADVPIQGRRARGARLVRFRFEGDQVSAVAIAQEGAL